MTFDVGTDTPKAATRPLRERQREERETLIVATAQAVFAELGYHDTSIDEIAARVGISKGTMYSHFASKEDLLGAVFERELDSLIAQIEEISRAEAPVRARLEQVLLQGYAGTHGIHPRMLELHNLPGPARDVVKKRANLRRNIEVVTDLISELIEEGKLTGELEAAIPTSFMLAAFLNLASPSYYARLLENDPLTPAEFVANVSRIFFQGVLAGSDVK
ncbi:MAG: TetR/AcrR family transcriptional regulator [Caldilineaceae bacterium]